MLTAQPAPVAAHPSYGKSSRYFVVVMLRHFEFTEPDYVKYAQCVYAVVFYTVQAVSLTSVYIVLLTTDQRQADLASWKIASAMRCWVHFMFGSWVGFLGANSHWTDSKTLS